MKQKKGKVKRILLIIIVVIIEIGNQIFSVYFENHAENNIAIKRPHRIIDVNQNTIFLALHRTLILLT